MMNYHNGHRLFLQAFISHKLLTEDETKTMYMKVSNICEVDGNPDEFSEFLQILNKQLEPLFMEICRGRAEDSGETFYSLVNTAEDEHSKLATQYPAHEIEFIKAALQMIVESQNGFLSTLDLVNVGMDLTKRISVQAAEEILLKLCNDGWVKEENGKVYFGPRAIIELGQYLKNMYKEQVAECMMCHDLVVMGDICDECGIKIHKYCAAFTFQKLPAERRKCPHCQEPWVKPLIKCSNPSSRSSNINHVAMETGDGSINHNVPVIPPSTSGHRSKRSSKQSYGRR